MSSQDNVEFLDELMLVYKRNRRKINRSLRLRDGESNIHDFCNGRDGRTSHENVCKLALVFSNVLGSRMPDSIHARMVLGGQNMWTKEYVEYVDSLLPRKFGIFNVNPNRFKRHTLGPQGWTPGLMYK